jgi:hypothetical protein
MYVCIYLLIIYVICIKVLPLAQTAQCRIVGQLQNKLLKMKWLLGIFLEAQMNITKNSGRIAGIGTEFSTCVLDSMKHGSI